MNPVTGATEYAAHPAKTVTIRMRDKSRTLLISEPPGLATLSPRPSDTTTNVVQKSSENIVGNLARCGSSSHGFVDGAEDLTGGAGPHGGRRAGCLLPIMRRDARWTSAK
jgi:hypothetical protein